MRYFGIDEANGLIPLLTQTFDRVRPMVQRLIEVEESLQGVSPADALRLGRWRLERFELFRSILGELEPLQEVGIEVKSADGLVDFRAQLHGRSVYLCWRYGETAIAHWHEPGAGYAHRHPIAHAQDFTPTYLS